MKGFNDIPKFATQEVNENITMNIQCCIWQTYEQLLKDNYCKKNEDIELLLEKRSPLEVGNSKGLNMSEFKIVYKSKIQESREFIISQFSNELKKLHYPLRIIKHQGNLVLAEQGQDLSEYGIIRE